MPPPPSARSLWPGNRDKHDIGAPLKNRGHPWIFRKARMGSSPTRQFIRTLWFQPHFFSENSSGPTSRQQFLEVKVLLVCRETTISIGSCAKKTTGIFLLWICWAEVWVPAKTNQDDQRWWLPCYPLWVNQALGEVYPMGFVGVMNGHGKKPTLEQTMNSHLHQAFENGRCFFNRLTFEILYDNKKDLLISVESHGSQMLNTEKWQCRTWKNGKTGVMRYDTNPNFKKLLCRQIPQNYLAFSLFDPPKKKM